MASTKKNAVKKAADVLKNIPTTYDPSKDYNWKQTDEFILDGVEFSTLYNHFKKLSSTTEDLTPIEKVQAFEILHRLLIKGVEQGYVVPAPTPQTN